MKVTTVTVLAAALAVSQAFQTVRPYLRSRMSALKMTEQENNDEFVVGILGDLHLDPRHMEDHYAGREHMKKFLTGDKACVVSLGDLGESKEVDETKQLFAGTSACLKLAKDYLDGFEVPFEVVGGNHDLEGIDEFKSDEENLQAYLSILDKPSPYFKRLIAHKTLLIGLGSTVFRDAVYTSHEVFIDEPQIEWFENTIKQCPAEDGWKVFVFSHAPPMGSGLRVLQENHVVNGCCWLNHSQKNTGKFIDIVRANPCIKAWFSGHFHLGQDYQDSITFPEGNNRGSCVFCQTAVMSKRSSRDGRQQSRLIRGNANGFTISTVNHLKDGEERLDATVTFTDSSHESVVYAHDSEDYDHDAWFSAYTPQDEDGCYVDNVEGVVADANQDNTVCWWHMACGRVLGVHNGVVLEYDASTLAPLGLVVGKDELQGRRVAVVDSGLNQQDGAAFEEREQAVILYDDEMNITVVQPNEDGSYWRKIVRNKMIRMKEKRRETAAKDFVAKMGKDPSAAKIRSSWGPYTSTVGTAKTTKVPGL